MAKRLYIVIFLCGVSGAACSDAKDFGCPENTSLVGLAPPLGFRQYCALDNIPDAKENDPEDTALILKLQKKRDLGMAIFHGRWVFWHLSGNMAQEGFYDRGRKHGLFRHWHRNGVLESEGRYHYDAKVGVWKEWFKNKQLRSTTRYTRSAMHGRRTIYHKNGKVSLYADYTGGNLVAWQAFDETGKFIERPKDIPLKALGAGESQVILH